MNYTTEVTTEVTAAVDAYMAAGLSPAEVAPHDWIIDHFGAAAWRETADGGYLIVAEDDTVLRVSVVTRNGVTHTEARFNTDRLGLAMFVAACNAL